MKKKHTRQLPGRQDSQSDWEKAASMTEAELEASIAGDPDEAGMVIDWSKATTEQPHPGKG